MCPEMADPLEGD
jgi:hypothetical protein